MYSKFISFEPIQSPSCYEKTYAHFFAGLSALADCTSCRECGGLGTPHPGVQGSCGPYSERPKGGGPYQGRENAAKVGCPAAQQPV